MNRPIGYAARVDICGSTGMTKVKAGFRRTALSRDTHGLENQKPEPFPRELAVLIVKKACRMAERFENQAIDQMTRDARGALQRGTDPATIVRQLDL